MGFEQRLPKWITGMVAFAQLLFTAAIIGLESGSLYYDVAHGTIWIGLWASFIFIKTFFVMFCILCCCRSRCCGTYILLLNIFSGLLACVMIYFDAYFINDPCKCYLGENICCLFHDLSSFTSGYAALIQKCSPALSNGTIVLVDMCPRLSTTNKLVLLKAQLACAVGMLTTCCSYVVLYILTCFGMCFVHKREQTYL